MELKIGELAKQAGIHIQTVRYYERKGLLFAPSRSASGYRYYSLESLKRLNFILKAKELGFSLKEVQELLELRADPKESCQQVQAQARLKQVEVQKKINFLTRLDHSLGQLIQACEHRSLEDQCPILTNLEDEA